MPELPEVETVCRGLAARVPGLAVAGVEVRSPGLRAPFPAGLARRLEGRRIKGVRRRAKYGLLDLDSGGALLFHLGMSGRVLLEGPPFPPPGPHDHLALLLAPRSRPSLRLTFRDPRRFGTVDLLAPGGEGDDPRLRDLGPEAPDVDGPRLAALLRGRRAPVKAALLDQRTVAGLGNIYACEALFRAGISPRRRAGSLGPARAERLARAVREVIAEAVESGGSSLRDHAQIGGEPGWFQHRFAVYGREGEPCPGCAGPVARTVQGGRSTFHCPACQR